MSDDPYEHKGRWWCDSCDKWHKPHEDCHGQKPTPISQEERAVIERAEAIVGGPRAAVTPAQIAEGQYAMVPVAEWTALQEAIRALQASRRPKDYAPEELEPGTRFRFASGEKAAWSDERVLVCDMHAKRKYVNLLCHTLHDFDEGERIAPITDQDQP